jgi:hypothetical protein
METAVTRFLTPLLAVHEQGLVAGEVLLAEV